MLVTWITNTSDGNGNDERLVRCERSSDVVDVVAVVVVLVVVAVVVSSGEKFRLMGV